VLQRLKEQAHLLRKATEDFYAGDHVSALPIAVIIRTLVHKTDKSTPLLGQIRPDYESLEIKDKMPDEADAAAKCAAEGGFVLLCSVGIQGTIGKGFSPTVDLTSPTYVLAPLGNWWTRACIIVPFGVFPKATHHAVFSKRSLALVLANKEGGAHVDPKLPPDYVALITNSPIHTFVNGVKTDTVNLARYAVAQAGVELLECVQRVFLS
jgi:hypothetical protein